MGSGVLGDSASDEGASVLTRSAVSERSWGGLLKVVTNAMV
jgi:hypothetical protein